MKLWLFYITILSLVFAFSVKRQLTLTEAKLAHCLSGGTFKVGHDALKCVDTIYEKGN
jgi:hypothetical protein